MNGGVTIDYHPQPEGEHNTRWWPEIKDPFEQFVTSHPRDPHPANLTWTGADSKHNRAHWLVIDEYGAAPGQAKDLPDTNGVSPSEAEIFPETQGRLFRGLKNAGRVDLERSGNTIRATTKGVAGFTLLLAPDRFDFNRPVKVMANGREVFNGRVER